MYQHVYIPDGRSTAWCGAEHNDADEEDAICPECLRLLHEHIKKLDNDPL